MALEVAKHARYFQMCMSSFPLQAESEDANKFALVYFCLQGLRILGGWNVTGEEAAGYAEYVYGSLITLGDIQGFRPGRTFKIDENSRKEAAGSHDMPSISATFFALASLLALELDYSHRIDRDHILRFVARCQVKEGPSKGAFRPTLDRDGVPFGEADMRTSYMAVGIARLCGLFEGIDAALATLYVTERVGFSGGFSSLANCEPHAGFTFCGLALLSLLDYDFGGASWPQDTLHWLVSRQVDYLGEIYTNTSYPSWNADDTGGFNGRDNKFADTCYSWWCTAGMCIMNKGYLRLTNIPQATRYLLERTQNRLIGGFGKDLVLRPDPLHSFLALASLALWESVPGTDLDLVDPVLVISGQLTAFLAKLWSPV